MMAEALSWLDPPSKASCFILIRILKISAEAETKKNMEMGTKSSND
jgi:hypothetical protein